MQKGDTYINLVKTNDYVNPDKVLQHPQYIFFLSFFAHGLVSCKLALKELKTV